ncbi:MAG: YigZ family protein [Bacteroidota bacterium]
MTSYQTLAEPSEGFFKDRGSRFLAFAYSVDSLEQVKDRLEDLRKTYHDARHHCYAYVLGMGTQEYRANDDGEPSHTAGDPILGQIKSNGLTNTLVVVVRYFGGTKLGVSGLINAYKIAASDALKAAKRLEIFPQVIFKLVYTYEQTNEVERLLASHPITLRQRTYAMDCEVTASIHEELFPQLLSLTAPPSELQLQVLSAPEDS